MRANTESSTGCARQQEDNRHGGQRGDAEQRRQQARIAAARAGGGGTACASGFSAPDSSAAATASRARAMVALAGRWFGDFDSRRSASSRTPAGTAPRGTSGGTGSCRTRSRVMSG